MHSLYGYGKTTNSETMVIITVILAVIGGIALYFTFLSKRNEGRYEGFLGWMYDFLTFKKMTVEAILRITYLIVAILITLISIESILMGSSFLYVILILIFGNLAARICYEFLLITLIICRNTTEINKKLGEEPKSKIKRKRIVRIKDDDEDDDDDDEEDDDE